MYTQSMIFEYVKFCFLFLTSQIDMSGSASKVTTEV